MQDESKLILVVEDNDVCRRLAVLQLTHLGYIAHTSANGKEALEQLSKVSYGLILMDLQMQVIGGIETTKAIRELEQIAHRPRIPIIALTGNPDRDSCLKAGMDDFIFKPASVDQLRNVLTRWLSPIG